jgi:group I intron endonuclease
MGRYSKYPKGAGIYKLTCNVNGKIYIGKSVNLRERLVKHKQNREIQNNPITNSIRKYGWDSFSVTILDVFDYIDNNELLLLESKYIEEYNSTDKAIGYNICKYSTDRTGIPHTNETKEKLRRANLGKIHSDETKQRLSDMFSGENHPMYGKHYDKSIIENRSGEKSYWFGKTGKLHPSYGKSHTEESKTLIKDKRQFQDMSHKRKSVVQIDLITEEDIKTWNSATEASKELGISQSGITEVCRKRIRNGWECKSSGGFGWRYK